MLSFRTPRANRTPCQPGFNMGPARAVVAALALCLLISFSAVAQDGETQDGDLSTFLDSVDVNLVNLEVFVTDRQGNRVDGLTREDFEVRVDGEPVELTNFHVVAPAPGSPSPSAPDPADPGTGAETVAAPPAPNREAGAAPPRPLFLTVYVDNVHIRPFNRKRLVDALEPVLKQRLDAGDQVMLVAFNRSLRILTPFTMDPEEVDAALEQIHGMATYRQLADVELRTLIRERPPDAVRVDSYQVQREQEALGSYKALRSVITGLAGVPGRKALLYVSDGIPRFPGEELKMLLPNGETSQLSGNRRRRDLRRTYRDVVRQANAHEVTLYTFDARGPSPHFGISAEGDIPVGVGFELTRNHNLQEPLMQMAADTGGQVIINTFNFAGVLEDVVRDFGSFYSLGFPAPEADGTYHDVDVRVRGRGLRVRHREGYLAKSPAARVADRTESFLLQGWRSNPMGVQLQFAAPEKKGRRWRVPVLVRVPVQAITLIPHGDEMAGRLQLFVAVRDGEGRASEVTRLERDVRIPKQALEEQQAGGEVNDLGYSVELEMRPGLQSLVVGVWDEVGGGESYVYQRVVVGEEG